MLRQQPLACAQRDVPFGNVLARRPDIGTRLQSRRQHNPAGIIDADIFLHEDGFGIRRHRRARKDARGVAGLDLRLCKAAGLDAAVERERPFRAVRNICVAHGVAIDGRVGERRQRQRRRNVARQHTPVRIDQRHGFEIGNRADARRDQANGLAD
ncbi:hypothetical protein ACVWW4_003479 [Bradyrhizobium sp. LB7.1]